MKFFRNHLVVIVLLFLDVIILRRLDYITRAGIITHSKLNGEIEPELKPYFNEVLSYIKIGCNPGQYNSTGRYRVVFDELNGDTIGECGRFIFGYEIIVDEWFFRHHSEDDRFQLVAHEMTHCLLGLDHVTTKGNYMNPYLDSRIKKRETIRQLNDNINKVCNRNNED